MRESDMGGRPERLGRIELVSRFIHGYWDFCEEERRRWEEEFARRRLPLPAMPDTPPPHAPPSAVPPAGHGPMQRSTFLSYILLIYTGTALFYSWIYLAERLVRRDFSVDRRHKIVQTGIAAAYASGEAALLMLLLGD